MKLSTRGKASSLTLPETVDAYQVGALHENLKKAAGGDKDLSIQGANVEHIDTLCCQLLASAKRSFNEAGQKMTFDKPSEKMLENFSRLGLKTFLMEAE